MAGWSDQFEPFNGKVIAALNEAYGTSLAITCNAAPVQIEGRLPDGRYLYFYERYCAWAIGISTDADGAVDESMHIPLEHGDHDWPAAISTFDAAAIIARALRDNGYTIIETLPDGWEPGFSTHDPTA